jgi:hypothetical protein
METYLLQPQDPADIDLLLGAIGRRRNCWTSTSSSGRPDGAGNVQRLMVPIVLFDQSIRSTVRPWSTRFRARRRSHQGV